MQRVPVILVQNLQLPTTYAAQYTVNGSGAVATVSAATLNNTSGSPVTVSISVVPSGQAQANANEIVTNLSIPAAGAAPTVISSLIGQHIASGGSLQMKASSATAISACISGYLTT